MRGCIRDYICLNSEWSMVSSEGGVAFLNFYHRGDCNRILPQRGNVSIESQQYRGLRLRRSPVATQLKGSNEASLICLNKSNKRVWKETI